MKRKLKAAGRVIIIFVTAMFFCMMPTFIWAGDNIMFSLQQPVYWASTVFIAAFVTWTASDSKK